MTKTIKLTKKTILLLILPLLLAFSSAGIATAAETESQQVKEESKAENVAKVKTQAKPCLTFSQLKPTVQKQYSKCIRNSYDKGRCKKRANMCLK